MLSTLHHVLLHLFLTRLHEHLVVIQVILQTIASITRKYAHNLQVRNYLLLLGRACIIKVIPAKQAVVLLR
jgi:hypothetical protein